MALLEVTRPPHVRSARTTASSGPSTASRFAVERGKTLGIVGESGSGKTVTSLSIMGLLPRSARTITSGEALSKGEDLLTLPQPASCARSAATRSR